MTALASRSPALLPAARVGLERFTLPCSCPRLGSFGDRGPAALGSFRGAAWGPSGSFREAVTRGSLGSFGCRACAGSPRVARRDERIGPLSLRTHIRFVSGSGRWARRVRFGDRLGVSGSPVVKHSVRFGSRSRGRRVRFGSRTTRGRVRFVSGARSVGSSRWVRSGTGMTGRWLRSGRETWHAPWPRVRGLLGGMSRSEGPAETAADSIIVGRAPRRSRGGAAPGGFGWRDIGLMEDSMARPAR
jgi:hypothetical protein